MKLSVLIFLLAISSTFSCQKYILLDSLKKYDVKEYTLNTKDIYSIDKEIDIYNFFISREVILLFSVLPPLEKDPILNSKQMMQNNWIAVDIEKVKNQALTGKQIYKLVEEWSVNNTPEKKTFDYKIVKKENGKYYASKYCLTELFNISSIEFPLISSYGVINIMDKEVSIKQMQVSFEKQFPDTKFILDFREQDYIRNLSIYYNYRNYLSKILTIKKKKAYQFWTFDGWWVQDGYNEHRGIDRFLYIPNKGIVGGSYDFYFKFKPKISGNEYFIESEKKLWDNIINEKIMLANELK
ncbi:hypothetical protein [Chryseobacterium cheonjiense]|uniref:Lipoprotein n=1 Tax=Chryseobacterium cheonjiense TaxID=2728845 RepID=A0A7Y0A7L6_9FLAO|nr:hypothetical protein [Chryseobacterium cheonjiense]NML58139.1 hypothetical protein [Chryseobacterium cheonjiense]